MVKKRALSVNSHVSVYNAVNGDYTLGDKLMRYRRVMGYNWKPFVFEFVYNKD